MVLGNIQIFTFNNMDQMDVVKILLLKIIRKNLW